MSQANVEGPSTDRPITDAQRNALHVYFRTLAKALNDAGLDMRSTLKDEIEIPWSEHTVKSHLWKLLQKAITNKTSVTQLHSRELNEIFDVLNLHLSQKLGIKVPFPRETNQKTDNPGL